MSNDKKPQINIMKLVKRLGMMLVIFRMLKGRQNKESSTKTTNV